MAIVGEQGKKFVVTIVGEVDGIDSSEELDELIANNADEFMARLEEYFDFSVIELTKPKKEEVK